jgi:hypothetical protein
MGTAMNAGTDQRWMPSIGHLITSVPIVVLAMTLSACAAAAGVGSRRDADLEEIYLLRSIRERQTPTATGCAASVTGFEPFPSDAERFFSFWSVRSRPQDGRVVDAKRERVAELRGCFGATAERGRQNFYAEVRLGETSFRGSGECLALMTAFPEEGLFPVRCQLILSGLPAPFVGGLLTTSTITSGALFGGETDPSGYTQASIATIRLWKRRSGR